ncbi:MAG: YegS/Rv2252/BmrU family lipid kinase [Saprospiraceae bacterium]|nr:YegS/Rv2252/BmrU family lipid kinase [Saprospiraceae bacterium]
MKRIAFIINPISGNGTQADEITYELLQTYFSNKDYEVRRQVIEKKGGTMELVQQAISWAADIIVACGGDGTINEVARHLVGTNIILGIIPRGSGNGLASHLKIPKKIENCLHIIKNGLTISIDTALAGDIRFFSNCGMGFPAELIHQYEMIPQRKLSGYFKAGLASLKSIGNAQTMHIRCNGRETASKHLFISNSNKMGYNMTLGPAASLRDGLLDVLIIPYRTLPGFALFGMASLIRKGHLLRKVTNVLSANIEIEGSHPLQIQADGEFHILDQRKISIINQPASLRVLVLNENKIP